MNTEPRGNDSEGLSSEGRREWETVEAETVEFPDGSVCLAADCPYCGYTAMIERDKWDDENEPADGCEHLAEIGEVFFIFEKREK